MDPREVRAYVALREIAEVPVCDIDEARSLLRGSDGKAYREVTTNIWANDADDEGVVYLGTGRHGGGIVLRPLFVRAQEGKWVNASTGKEASPDLASAFDARAGVSPGSANPLEPTRVLAPISWAERCEGLAEICESFAWSMELKDVYQHVCDVAARVLRCSQVHLHLVNIDATRFVKCAYHVDELNSTMWEDYRPLNIGRVNWMMENMQPIIMDYEHPHLEDVIPDTALEDGVLGAVSIPLQANGRVLGMLSAVYRVRTAWSEEDCSFLVLLGRVAGALIQRLYDTKKASDLQLLNERKLLSTEIHENVSSLLGALSVNAAAAIAAFEEGRPDLARADLARLELTAGETMRILRDEMFSLRISLEETDGLVEGVESALALFGENWGIATELSIAGEVPVVVPMHVSLQMTRILNECLSNTLKHARASKVGVELRNEPARLVMRFEDDGVGFDVDAVGADRFGIKIMRERAAAAGGEISILSGEGGTIVCVAVEKRQRYQEGLRTAQGEGSDGQG